MTVVALTTRITTAPGHGEVRDSIAHDWITYLARIAPDVDPLLVPNRLRSPTAWAERFGVDALVLTGGEDLGDSPRDETEHVLLQYAQDAGLPILAVCRGLQLVNTVRGGRTERVEGHVATWTPVTHRAPWEAGTTGSVPCYHLRGIPPDGLAAGLQPTAVDDAGWIEAAVGDAGETGVMWHPERRLDPDPDEDALVRGALGLGGGPA